MFKQDAIEASGVVYRLCQRLLTCIPAGGENGALARTALGDLMANALALLSNDQIGPPLQDCFELVQACEPTWQQIDTVRQETEAEAPVTLGGALLQNSGIALCLATESEIIGSYTFVSRQDVDNALASTIQPFDDAIETAADDMDQATTIALIQMRAALTNHLITTGRPLPRMVNYQFAQVMPSLVIAYRLYADASRADEIRNENKIVHPAFCPVQGIALSS